MGAEEVGEGHSWEQRRPRPRERRRALLEKREDGGECASRARHRRWPVDARGFARAEDCGQQGMHGREARAEARREPELSIPCRELGNTSHPLWEG
jgi:hypothetical protein